MHESITLESIKTLLEKFSSKKTLFTDSEILNKIEENSLQIKNSLEKGNNLINLLKRCSKEVGDLKQRKDKMETGECVECLLLLNKIKKEIESMRKETVVFKRRIRMLLWGIPIVIVIYSLMYLKGE